ncbi:hypothetical protein L6452_13737 [Arctium lappa]|uniref:Uncharacterized protein n=1 Tax=Arctium lappa TaxID=4217 RepID=A0ACB9CJ10_ARCLA|nr:hypothetical protein L6452_13737 [Arctium lappa]
MIKKELDKIVHALATALENAKTCAGEDATLLREIFLKIVWVSGLVIFSGYEVGHLVFTRDETNSLQQVVEGLQSRRPMIDDLLKQSGMSEEPQKVVSESRNTSVEEETANEDGNDDNSRVPESVPRKQTSGGNTEEAGFFNLLSKLYSQWFIRDSSSDVEGKYPYTGYLDCAMKTLKVGGSSKFYTGLRVYCVRIAAHVMWIFGDTDDMNLPLPNSESGEEGWIVIFVART